ncbi:hypothetical protein PSQ19_12750 [Devosia algicola]|uniref:Uncharacterized protein n=1 Tax=Devosia algicola TaxID=3026418 RepID=A0ABY7YKJ8_9HYPH|nr:hypothetical protein [Devosia algicola]WDR01630.1 hypothetical protein PSQ19_12750 [Devosia algicola]
MGATKNLAPKQRSIKCMCCQSSVSPSSTRVSSRAFEFIADVLVAARGRFYAVPGKGHELSVTVSTKTIADEIIVQAVYLGGVNILRSEDRDADVVDGPLRYRKLSPEELKHRLCAELVVPDRLLNLAFTPKSSADEEELLYPRYWTVRSA